MPRSMQECHALGQHRSYSRPRCPDCRAEAMFAGKATTQHFGTKFDVDEPVEAPPTELLDDDGR
jgi:hypothetical protein